MVGMLSVLLFLEENKSIPQQMLDDMKWICAENAEVFLDKPAEDIILMASNKEI